MTTTIHHLVQGTFFWRATIETDGMIYTAQTVFPASLAKADVVRAIAEKCPEVVIDPNLAEDRP